jgi:hypothetical protein
MSCASGQTITGQSGATSVTTGLIAGLQRDHAAMLNGLTVRTASLRPAGMVPVVADQMQAEVIESRFSRRGRRRKDRRESR